MTLTIRVAMLAMVAVTGLAMPLPAAAQTTAVPDDAVGRLGRFIRTLTTSPRDLNALLGAGQAALDVGDANAALGFFARAEEASPSNARAKAGLAASLVQIERPDEALRLFAEAVALGIREVDIARDRGLAYDLRGDTARAQADYALAATRGSDDELTRRWALSLGISGQREAALTKLSPLLYRQDQGAWRARAFIYAMTGDVSGANAVARQLMAPAMAAAMAPLLARLVTLNPAERAQAVNFGTVPSDGAQMATVRTGDPYLANVIRPPAAPTTTATATGAPRVAAATPVARVGSGLIPSGAPLGTLAVPRTVVEPGFSAPARVAPPAATAAPLPAPQPTTRLGARIGPVDPARIAALGTTGQIVPGATALPPPDRVVALPPAALAVSTITSATLPPSQVAQAEVTATPPVATLTTATPPATPAVTAATARLANLLAGVEPEPETRVELPSERELRTARNAARRKIAQLAAADAEARAAKAKADAEAAEKRSNPARIWVQIATGNNERGLGTTWRRIRTANSRDLAGQSAWFAPFRATNRVLVGPMRSAAAARALAAKLEGAMVWTSEAGEKVSRIAGQ